MMISECYKTKNLAFNQQKFVGVDHNLPTRQNYFSGFKSHDYGMVTIEQLSVALIKQCNCHPIPPSPLAQSKTNDCSPMAHRSFIKQTHG